VWLTGICCNAVAATLVQSHRVSSKPVLAAYCYVQCFRSRQYILIGRQLQQYNSILHKTHVHGRRVNRCRRSKKRAGVMQRFKRFFYKRFGKGRHQRRQEQGRADDTNSSNNAWRPLLDESENYDDNLDDAYDVDRVHCPINSRLSRGVYFGV